MALNNNMSKKQQLINRLIDTGCARSVNDVMKMIKKQKQARSNTGCCACFFIFASFMAVICYIVFAEFYMHISHKPKI